MSRNAIAWRAAGLLVEDIQDLHDVAFVHDEAETCVDGWRTARVTGWLAAAFSEAAAAGKLPSAT